MTNYYVAVGNDRRGPFTIEQLQAQGIGPESLVWAEGMAEWQPASRVPALSAILSVPPGPTFPPSPSMPFSPPPAGGFLYSRTEVNSKKVMAGVLGILFGGLGVHKFVLGFAGAGAIMLCVSLATCGFGAMVMGPIGLIEGIIYLTKSDEEFYQLYMVEKKQWF